MTAHSAPVLSTEKACAYCETELKRVAPAVGTSTTAYDLDCTECGARFYADPAEDARLETEWKLGGAAYYLRPSAEDTEAERRRKFRLARLAERLLDISTLGAQQRGYQFEQEVARLFAIEGLTFEASYRRGGREQVDGALDLDGWHYLVECRWKERPARWQEVLALQAQVRQSSRQTMGLFVSMNGWSPLAVTRLQRDGQQAVILVDGEDIRAIVVGARRLGDSIREKARYLALRGEPFLARYAQ